MYCECKKHRRTWDSEVFQRFCTACISWCNERSVLTGTASSANPARILPAGDFILHRAVLDTEAVANAIAASLGPDKRVALFVDGSYEHCKSELAEKLRPRVLDLVCSQTMLRQDTDSLPTTASNPRPEGHPIPENTKMETSASTSSGSGGDASTALLDDASRAPCQTISVCGRECSLPSTLARESFAVCFVGPECAWWTLAMTCLHTFELYRLDPETVQCVQVQRSMNRALMRRYYLIERVRDADVVGILVGTLNMERNIEVIDHLRKLIRESGKKSYTVVIGKLNEAKVSNFLEVDAFVTVACPLSSLLTDEALSSKGDMVFASKYKPVVTPMELQIALDSEAEWTGSYTTDARWVLQFAGREAAARVVHQSLLSNRVREMGIGENEGSRGAEEADVDERQVAQRTMGGALSTAATQVVGTSGALLARRTYRGLGHDDNFASDPATNAEGEQGTQIQAGRSGVAMEYGHEPLQDYNVRKG